MDPWRWALFAPVVVLVFQVLTLNIMSLNADETLYQLIVEELGKITHGQWPALNPLVPYEGPLDFWILGSIFTIFHSILGMNPSPWLFRAVPLIAVTWGAWVLYREIEQQFPERKSSFAFVLSISPMVLVFSRVAFPQSFMLGLFLVLFAEALRVHRTSEVRWLRIALLAGLAIEAHITAVVGLGAIFLPVLRHLVAGARRRFHHFALGLALLIGLAWPVMRNFPLPISATPGVHWYIEVRSFLNILSGHQPFRFMLTKDAAPVFLLVGFLILLIGAFVWHFSVLVKGRTNRLDRHFLHHGLATGAGTLFLLFMCYRGRTLMDLGTERYFLSLLPGWIFLQSDLLFRARQRFTIEGLRAWVVLGGLFLFFLVRLALPLVQFAKQEDPLKPAAAWLMDECPSGTCVAYSDGYASYWPLKFYSKNRLALNSLWSDWKPVPYFDPTGKKQAGCWAKDSERSHPESFEKRRDFAAGPGRPAYSCYSGINLKP